MVKNTLHFYTKCGKCSLVVLASENSWSAQFECAKRHQIKKQSNSSNNSKTTDWERKKKKQHWTTRIRSFAHQFVMYISIFTQTHIQHTNFYLYSIFWTVASKRTNTISCWKMNYVNNHRVSKAHVFSIAL